jgi:hypothetical protein
MTISSKPPIYVIYLGVTVKHVMYAIDRRHLTDRTFLCSLGYVSRATKTNTQTFLYRINSPADVARADVRARLDAVSGVGPNQKFKGHLYER